MLRLDIIRHAKAKKLSISGQDIDRKLSKRGILQAMLLANFILKDNIWNHPFILCSHSTRTRQTAEYICGDDKKLLSSVTYREDLYLASSSFMLQYLMKFESDVHHIVIIGHNNGISELLSYLSGEARMMSTGSFYSLQLNIDHWNELHSGCAEVLHSFFQ
ncbi:MAG TPA: histidine phosphatase family protein [Bacteroidia bacterium]|nr:histidine phosphatase family protein [Bacteroidia bacterium]HNT79266.1 histidine phosphatase family protein [Bacteroidia bacterium]